SDVRAATARADLYSLGCTLYSLLAGSPPFADSRTYLQKIQAHCHSPVPPMRERRPEVPPALAAILDRLLAKPPEQRPASAAEAAAQLEPFCVGANLAGLLAQAEQV